MSPVNIHLFRIEANLFLAKQHARNVARRLPTSNGLIYLEGMPEVLFEDSDQAIKFRQKRYFLYLTGVVDMPDCFVTYSIAHDRLTLCESLISFGNGKGSNAASPQIHSTF